jgi:hypothetical protein
MGIERAVTRWYIQRQTYEHEVAQLEAKFGEMQTDGQESERKELAEIEKQLNHARTKLHFLGPCPKVMMG